jgi:site-specific recombinase XerD
MADHLTVAGRAEATIVNYVRGLRDLQAYYDLPADELSRDQLIAFLAGRKAHISSSTLNTLICSLKYYYREVLRCQELIVDLPNPRYSKQLGDLLDADEVRTLLRATRSLRHRIVIELIFSLGLRVAEVGRLRLGDFDRTQPTLIIRTSKGNVTRVLPYGERLRGTLIDYFRQEKPVDYLIPGRERRPARHWQTLWALRDCRTAVLGGHIEYCGECRSIQRISYNSCRNRHCPKPVPYR